MCHSPTQTVLVNPSGHNAEWCVCVCTMSLTPPPTALHHSAMHVLDMQQVSAELNRLFMYLFPPAGSCLWDYML